jgi:hypothetical protein
MFTYGKQKETAMTANYHCPSHMRRLRVGPSQSYPPGACEPDPGTLRPRWPDGRNIPSGKQTCLSQGGHRAIWDTVRTGPQRFDFSKKSQNRVIYDGRSTWTGFDVHVKTLVDLRQKSPRPACIRPSQDGYGVFRSLFFLKAFKNGVPHRALSSTYPP